MTLRCDCGDEVKDWRGARGHVQFSGDDLHGEKMSLPDDWKELLDEVDSQGDESDDEDEHDGGDEEATDEEVAEAVRDEESQSDQSDGTESKGRLRRILSTPLDELLGVDR